MWLMRIGVILACWFVVWVVTFFFVRLEWFSTAEGTFFELSHKTLFPLAVLLLHAKFTTAITTLIVLTVCLLAQCWVRWTEPTE